MKDTSTAYKILAMCLRHSAPVRRALGARLGLDSLERASGEGRQFRPSILHFDEVAVVLRLGDRKPGILCRQMRFSSEHLEKIVEALWIVEDEHAATANAFAGDRATRECGKVAVLAVSELLTTLGRLVGIETLAELRDALGAPQVEVIGGIDFAPSLDGVRLWMTPPSKDNEGLLAAPANLMSLLRRVAVAICNAHRAEDVVVAAAMEPERGSLHEAPLGRESIGYTVHLGGTRKQDRIAAGAATAVLSDLFFGWWRVVWATVPI